jgi:hypothetical protein
MNIIRSISSCIALGVVAAGAATDRIALLRANDPQVIVVGVDGHEMTRLTQDRRPKSRLAWLTDGNRVSYVVASNDKAQVAGRLVVVDLSGNIIRESPIPPPDEGFRVDDSFTWVSDHKVRIDRSANPRNCETFDLDIETMKISNGQIGACGSFVTSPDGEHNVHLGLLAITSDEDRTDSVEIDNERIVYTGGGDRVRVVAGPIWSEDSKDAAFVERRLPSGDLSVTVLSLAGHFDKVPLADRTWREDSVIAWVEGRVVVSAGGQPLLIDHAHKRTEKATVEALAKIDGLRQARRDAKQVHIRMQELAQHYAAREAVAWTAK